MAVEDRGVIDLVVLSGDGGGVGLVLIETRRWESDEQLYELQEKVNEYASFALDGGLDDTYPDLAGKPVTLELRCVQAPTPHVEEFLGQVRDALATVGLGFNVAQIGTRRLG